MSADRAEADRLAADAAKYRLLPEAEGVRAAIEADYAHSEATVEMELEKARLEALPRIVAEMARPAEKIRSINIHQIGGYRASGGGDVADRAPVAQAMDRILNMAVQLAVPKKIGEAVGMDIADSLTDLKGGPRKS